ncbi:hypothetical protein TIFTF001_006725 [Ficus carica]|uniref:Amidase domain-containing protein n=1 Tax=Ficus carica TaxID=3494 RepID=A0AA88D027_FICCA|nr:hypothetical protein TIFTF001_006725 [Ficus carica]
MTRLTRIQEMTQKIWPRPISCSTSHEWRWQAGEGGGSKHGKTDKGRLQEVDVGEQARCLATHVLAIGGFPAISVPAGYDEGRVPFGITFGGLKGSEPELIQIAHGFEQATKVRKPPKFLP